MNQTEALADRKTEASHPHKSTWDNHGSYQWTYFSEEVKQRISFFLSQRLSGRNLDLGGGWYLHYPNSTVVDLSSVCLSHNPAREKLQFDLDELATGKHLPYADHSFDSATMVSVWQYLLHPHALTEELKRVLKPGAEFYLINGQGGALQECSVRSGRSEEIKKHFHDQGYDTLVEVIPSHHGDVHEFQSVCVAMPTPSIFGDTISRVTGKKERLEQNALIQENPSLFEEDFIDWEIGRRSPLLLKLATFPITRDSMDYQERVEGFSQEYHCLTGELTLAFLELGIEPTLAMLVAGEQTFHPTVFFIGEDHPADNCTNKYDDLFKKHSLRLGLTSGFFPYSLDTVTELLNCCRSITQQSCCDKSRGHQSILESAVRFIASLGLNSFTKKLQAEVYEALKPGIPDLDNRIEDRKAYALHSATWEHKQNRKVAELLAIKSRIKSEGIEVIGEGNLDFLPYLPRLRKFVKV